MKKLTLFLAFIIPLFIILVSVMSMSIRLEQNCTGHLKRAADANNPDTAKKELKIALDYIEENGLTSGYTSVLWNTPDEDVGFWYNNIKDSYIELESIDSTTSSLEKSNVLMKLRETLLDNKGDKDSLTVPQGLSRYPDNFIWGMLRWLAIILFIVIVFAAGYIFDNN